MPYPERRRHPRFPFHSSGILELAGTRYSGTLIDISLNGALIRPAQPVGADATESCCLELLNGNNQSWRINAVRIAQRRGEMLGLEFLDLNGDAEHFLAMLIEMNLGVVATLLDRELPAMLGGSPAGQPASGAKDSTDSVDKSVHDPVHSRHSDTQT